LALPTIELRGTTLTICIPIEMKTLDDFFENVEKILKSKQFDDCDYPVFRGHSKGSFNLVPTLLRDWKKSRVGDVWTLENKLYNDFRVLVGPRIRFHSAWEELFAMRHEGVPTRLLDWTENIGTALFFALDAPDKEIERPHIWILNPYTLNEKSFNTAAIIDPEDLDPYNKTYADFCNQVDFNCHDLPIALYPRRTNERIFAQRGLFTIHGRNEGSIEAICPQAVIRIDLTDEVKAKLKKVLPQFGINKYSVYPDFKGLSDHLKELYYP
jgi:hypothetical protein